MQQQRTLHFSSSFYIWFLNKFMEFSSQNQSCVCIWCDMNECEKKDEERKTDCVSQIVCMHSTRWNQHGIKNKMQLFSHTTTWISMQWSYNHGKDQEFSFISFQKCTKIAAKHGLWFLFSNALICFDERNSRGKNVDIFMAKTTKLPTDLDFGD